MVNLKFCYAVVTMLQRLAKLSVQVPSTYRSKTRVSRGLAASAGRSFYFYFIVRKLKSKYCNYLCILPI